MDRPRVSVFLALSLDGHIAGENGDLSWLEPYSTDPPEHTGFSALMRSIDVMVFGRNTFEVVRSFDPWPYAGKRIIVLTHRSMAPAHGAEAWNGPLEDLLRALRREGCGHVYLDGGEVARQGFALDAVDELTISWVPVILGKGIPLFGPGLEGRRWVLQESRALPSGLLQGIYAREKGIQGKDGKNGNGK